MLTVMTVAELRECVGRWRAQSNSVALVPTMGNLHAGHIQLVRHARAIADRVVVSVFVNPMQFGRNEDYARYPITHERDRSALVEADADLLFRPTHFDGVTTVVAKLFNMVQPDIAVFGEKDFQQLLIIRRMVEDLDMSVAIEAVATVREDDGLAMSSRNGYLSAGERALAPQLYQTLLDVRDLILQGDHELAGIEQAGMVQLREAGFEPQYVSIRRSADLSIPASRHDRLVVLAAAMLGSTHLIDNISVSTG